MRLPVVRSCLRFLDIVRLETGSKPPLIRLMVGARDCSVLPSSNVRFGSKADICAATSHVRFTPNSDRESQFPQRAMSALPPKADMCSAAAYVRFGPILLQKSFCAGDQKFCGLRERLSCKDVRDLIASR